MPNDQQLSNEKSLEIIHQMIQQAKNNITDSGLSWLLWGTMLFLTCIATYIFIDMDARYIFLGWNVFGGITIVLLSYDIFRPKQIKARTYVDDLMQMVDIAFIVCMFVIIVSMNVAVGPNAGFAFMLMIFAFLMLVKGGAIKSNSLKVGAIVNWAGAIAILINEELKYDMLIMAGAVLVGYIIPGLILRAEYRKQTNALKK